jgi:hypothetical protein
VHEIFSGGQVYLTAFFGSTPLVCSLFTLAALGTGFLGRTPALLIAGLANRLSPAGL